MKLLLVPVTLWLLLWAGDTGVLVSSTPGPGNASDRVCRYLIGLTVVDRVVRYDPYYGRQEARCSLLARV